MFLSFFAKKYPTPTPSAAPIIVPTTGTAEPIAAPVAAPAMAVPAAAAPPANSPPAIAPPAAPARPPATLKPTPLPMSPRVYPPAFFAASVERFILLLVSCRSLTSRSTPLSRIFSPFGPRIDISFEFTSIPKE